MTLKTLTDFIKTRAGLILCAGPLCVALYVHGSTKPTPTHKPEIAVTAREVRSIDIAVTVPAEFVGCRATPRIMEEGETEWTPLMSQAWDITAAETQEPHHITGNYVHDGKKHYISLQLINGETATVTSLDMGELQ